MAKFTVVLPDKLGKQFRQAVGNRGAGKGQLSKAFKEAVQDWLKKEKGKKQ